MRKYGSNDIRNVLERASARETAARVVVGAVAKRLLAEINVTVESCVVAIGDVSTTKSIAKKGDGGLADRSNVRVLEKRAVKGIKKAIDDAAMTGDTLGGVFEVVVFGAPVGLGSYAQWDRRLDGALAAAVMSIPAVKGVEIGEGFEIARIPGSQAHDEIFYSRNHGYYRKTNRAGGLEGGITNGEPVRVKAAMKPIPTLGKPLQTVDTVTKKPAKAAKERADVCAVPAASIVAEAMVAITMAGAVLEKFGGDSLAEFKTNFNSYLKRVKP
jgi:chorismate synthase